MTALEDSNDLTLEGYIKSLSNEDRELVSDLPLDDIDALIDMDYDELQEIKNKTDQNQKLNLTEEQQFRRLEIIAKIVDLHSWAVVERGSKQHTWATGVSIQQKPFEVKKEQRLHEHTTYKFSQIGRGELHEAVILDGSPKFIVYDAENKQFRPVDKIEQQTRILTPPSPEEYPYTPYEFTEEELYTYIKRAKSETIESLFKQVLEIVEQYNAQDEYKLILMATDIVWSYFQDKFGTTHYVGVVGDNGSGKSTAGNTFEALAYRCANTTNPSAANIFRILGVIEPGQCTLVLDETRNIDESPDMISILNTGYDYHKRVAKINTNILKQEFFFTYGLKVIIGEVSFSQFKARGVLDRTLQFTTYPAEPKYDIKEIASPQGDPIRERELKKLIDFRKLMLVYRLIHFKDPITDVDVGIRGRNKELVKPYIQLFYGTSVQSDIENTLQTFINTKNEKKSNSLEHELVPIILNLIRKEGNDLVSVSKVWQEIVATFGGRAYINVNGEECYPDEYHTSEYGTLYKKSVIKLIYDKLGAEPKREGHDRTRSMRFDKDKLQKVQDSYNAECKIRTTLKNMSADNEDNEDNDSEGVVRNLIEDNEKADNADIPTGTNNNGINKFITSSDDNSCKNYNNPSMGRNMNADSNSESNVLNVRNVRMTKQPRNAGKIHRIGRSDRFECKDCSLKDDIHFMRNHDCSGFNKPNQ